MIAIAVGLLIAVALLVVLQMPQRRGKATLTVARAGVVGLVVLLGLAALAEARHLGAVVLTQSP